MAEKEIKTEVETEETSNIFGGFNNCLLYTSPSPRDRG